MVVTSSGVRDREDSDVAWRRKRRKSGMLVALDWVIRKRWIVSWKRALDARLCQF